MAQTAEHLDGLKSSIARLIESYKNALTNIARLEAVCDDRQAEITELLDKASLDRAVIEALVASINSAVMDPVDPGASLGGIVE